MINIIKRFHFRQRQSHLNCMLMRKIIVCVKNALYTFPLIVNNVMRPCSIFTGQKSASMISFDRTFCLGCLLLFC